jgi:hypothetical protein
LNAGAWSFAALFVRTGVSVPCVALPNSPFARIGAKDCRSSEPCPAACCCAGFAVVGGNSLAIRNERISAVIRARIAMIETRIAAFIGSNHLFTLRLYEEG